MKEISKIAILLIALLKVNLNQLIELKNVI